MSRLARLPAEPLVERINVNADRLGELCPLRTLPDHPLAVAPPCRHYIRGGRGTKSIEPLSHPGEDSMKYAALLVVPALLVGCLCPGPSDCSSGKTVTAKVSVSDGTRLRFPEQEHGIVPREDATGICLSGGGTRALSAAMGQLRGLRSLSLIDRIDYISCVSGGSWAATAYTYYSQGAKDDDQFLGPVTPPDEITLEKLTELDDYCLGITATHDLEKRILKLLERSLFDCKLPADQVWIDAITHIYLKRFGLGDRSMYFSLSEKTVAEIQSHNKIALGDAKFHVVRTKDGHRPFLVINSCLVGPSKKSPFDPLQLSVFQYTPLYVGTPMAQRVHYESIYDSSENVEVGGGFVEPFAFGCKAPAGPPVEGRVELPLPAAPFSLGDATGTSSSAYSGVDDNFLGPLSPHEPYWPVSTTGDQETTEFNFGDGGNLENYGLISLLQRKVKRIVVFINTSTKLDLNYDAETPPMESDLDSNLPPLFGHPVIDASETGDMTHNRVFEKKRFADLVDALQKQKCNKKTVLHRMTLKVQANSWWGVDGGWDVNILWVYNDRVLEWERQIKCERVRRAIKRGNKPGHKGYFPYFPNYKTIGENDGKLIPHLVELTRKQVNLLADLSCWNVKANAETFTNLLKPTTP